MISSRSSASARSTGRWRDDLRLWQRFPLRLMLAYGISAFLLISGLSAWTYKNQMDAEMGHLQKRLLTLATALSLQVDGDAVFGLEDEEARAYFASVYDDFRRLGQADGDAEALYVLRVTDEYGKFEHILDVDMSPEPDEVDWLFPYDGSDLPRMMEGLEHPTVEEQLWEDEYGLSISGYAPVKDATGRSVAIAGADVMARDIRAMQRNALFSTLMALAVAVVVLGGVTVVIGRQIVKPLGMVIDASDAIAGGDLDVHTELARTDEFGLLGRYFNSMVVGLREREFIRATFGRYVSERVAEAVLADEKVEMGGEEREVTVMFSDLRGYSTLAEHADPPDVVRLLNEYFGEMNEIIDAHGGDVIEFLGDGILAVFGAPVPLPGHPERAVEAALAMRERLDGLNDEWEANGTAHLWQDRGFERLVARIGLHTGRVIAGNLGSTKRTKYAVIGDNVNVAARLEQLNKKLGSTIAISGVVLEHLPEGKYTVEARGPEQVKGRQDAVEVYTL
ncbi:MAG: adenylate/guanylate cyclase domain-containing protein [Deltaproteobacteria bacterium]|nr:adenylate/guanylate cyclase domain-containing protein [Deltaproteobacteria bacterium]